MYFKRLEIFGFKSFADKTILNFEPGITAIVGPNGCGKSNIFDSIRWVLGEQSVKELRGASMDDVIFNGTDKKSGLGFAEVSLTFSNESRMLPTEYDEVTVTRRLFRSGESEYLLNKSVVRLKDILELFMGTGIGAEAYSLIQQGKVDLIVSARPEDRRIIIDEAAGITKYKSKKREALNKLKDTDDNLLRINDIIVEVKRQIGSLERQANKARRYKDELEKLKIFEVKFATYQISQFNSEKEEINRLVSGLQDQENQLNAELEKLNSSLSEQEALIAKFEQAIDQIYADDLKLENQVAMNNKQIGFNEERIANILSNEARFEQQREQLSARCRMQQEKIEALKNALSFLKTSLIENMKTLGEKKDSLHLVAEAIREAKDSIRKAEEEILNLNVQQVAVKNQVTEVMKEFQNALARKRRLELENAKVISEKEEIDSKLRNILSQIEECTGKIKNLEEERQNRNRDLDATKGRFTEIEELVNNLEKKKLSLISQRQFIEELRVQYQDMPDPVVEGTLLTNAVPLENLKGIIGKVKQARLVDPQKTGDLKNHFTQINTNQLWEVICEMKFIELDPEKITARIDELSREIEEKNQAKGLLLSEIKAQEEAIAQLVSAIHDLEKVFSSYDAQKNNILQEESKLVGELDLVTEEIREVRSTVASLKTKEDELALQLETIEQGIQSYQNQIKERQDAIAVKSQEKEDTTVAIAQLETEIESAQDKEKSEQENLTMFEEELESGLGEIKKLEEEKESQKVKKAEFAQGIETLKEEITQLNLKGESLKKALSESEEQKAKVLVQVGTIRQGIDKVQKDVEEIHDVRHGHQMKEQEISYKEKSIKDRLLQAYKINFDELPPVDASLLADAQSTEPAAEQPVLTPDALASEIERLKQKCDSYGTVNLVAIEEFDELRQRFEFLTKQQSDLLTAKESLQDTIGKINRTTRQLFLDTFTKVSEEFRIYFRMLFGGGEAQLVLVDPENVLESGIEIIARPPGKKLQGISLLSGGEKTLAAIALIFGVFKVRPSPFCILDEIDAALDESNVGRFGYLLKDFAKISQFIVITHNKKTIVNANVMYGITMQETGISKIVSVKFADDEQKEARQEDPVAVA
ncbi:MAG: AAA family ATPase [Candidatus Omnitrophota bacterium]